MWREPYGTQEPCRKARAHTERAADLTRRIRTRGGGRDWSQCWGQSCGRFWASVGRDFRAFRLNLLHLSGTLTLYATGSREGTLERSHAMLSAACRASYVRPSPSSSPPQDSSRDPGVPGSQVWNLCSKTRPTQLTRPRCRTSSQPRSTAHKVTSACGGSMHTRNKERAGANGRAGRNAGARRARRR